MSEAYIGIIFNVGYTFAPVNYAACDGQTMAINQNAALFSLLGTTYGGNGSTTFQLPNLQGRNAIHRGSTGNTQFYGQGAQGGTENVSLTVANLATHNHIATYTNSGGSTLIAENIKGTTNVPAAGARLARPIDGDGTPSAVPYIYVPAAASNQVNLSSINVAGTVSNAIAGTSSPTNIVKPYQVVLSIICIAGLYPSRN